VVVQAELVSTAAANLMAAVEELAVQVAVDLVTHQAPVVRVLQAKDITVVAVQVATTAVVAAVLVELAPRAVELTVALEYIIIGWELIMLSLAVVVDLDIQSLVVMVDSVAVVADQLAQHQVV